MKEQVAGILSVLSRWRRGLAYPTDALYEIAPLAEALNAELKKTSEPPPQPSARFRVYTFRTDIPEVPPHPSLDIPGTFSSPSDAQQAIDHSLEMIPAHSNRVYEVREIVPVEPKPEPQIPEKFEVWTRLKFTEWSHSHILPGVYSSPAEVQAKIAELRARGVFHPMREFEFRAIV